MGKIIDRFRQRRQERQGSLKQFINARKVLVAAVESFDNANDMKLLLKAVEDGNITKENWREYFKPAWMVVSSSLSLIMLFTNDKTDKIISEVVVVGNAIANGKVPAGTESQFLENFATYWKYIRIAFMVAMSFTGDKVDKVLNAIIEYGDVLAEVAE